MTSLTEAYIDSLAPNAGAMKNGRDLVKKNSFPVLRRTEDGTLLFGECKGSGKEPYRCSVDFVQPDSPVSRCSCPSRQFPCKHTLGLMYAYALGKPFELAELPPDIAEKRGKAEKREEKKKETEAAESGGTAPARRKVNKSALAKKINAQLEGLHLLEKMVLQTVQGGLGSLSKKNIQLLEEQAKELGNYYVPGVQAELRELILLFGDEGNREAVYSKAIEQLIRIHSLVKKGKAYLERRLAEPEMPLDTDSTIEEQLGHAWQLAELKEYGRTRQASELLQLSFLSYTDLARGEYVDAGWWADLQDGMVHATRNLRPFRAAKQLKEEDTVYAVVQTDELYQYPGEINARVRWEKGTFREAAVQDYKAVKGAANGSFPDVIKQVKNIIKNPLSGRNPVVLIAYHTIEKSGEGYLFRDKQGKPIPVTSDMIATPARFETVVPLLQEEELRDQAALVMFRHDMDSGRLSAQPMSIITDSRIIRLLY
ncbi:SWIM zinc finger protein [Paenibacillus sp. BK033]|uniref:SWIM zinc finger family protein n=1 Tax=Paenibacillus sp. BK033 TaxID=2512133 RepID=UPI0010438240|nr:SWIM zinc finger family protein [Paenibacillus sp. BK033]TCM96360.1 SWIM zinc finger protein [Paenibacillus sp. BK033]